MTDRAYLKGQARISMRQTKPSVYLVALVYLLIGYVISVLDTRIQLGMSYEEYLELILSGREIAGSVSWLGSLIAFALSLMSMVLAYGFSFYALKVSRNENASFGELFDGFGLFFKVIFLNIVIGIFVFLWSLLLVIPGIIASYRYSMAFFILMDDPDLSVMECIRRSKELTRGRKGELFVLDLSFLGWMLLALIPFVGVFVQPYCEITKANFYNTYCGYVPMNNGDDAYTGTYNNYKEPWE